MMNAIDRADLSDIYNLLRLLGIGANYRGYHVCAVAVKLCMEDSNYLLLVTKNLYPEVAKICGCSWRAVERAIRTTAARAWERNPQLLTEIARYPLTQPPTASDFIDMLSDYLSRQPAGEA